MARAAVFSDVEIAPPSAFLATWTGPVRYFDTLNDQWRSGVLVRIEDGTAVVFTGGGLVKVPQVTLLIRFDHAQVRARGREVLATALGMDPSLGALFEHGMWGENEPNMWCLKVRSLSHGTLGEEQERWFAHREAHAWNGAVVASATGCVTDYDFVWCPSHGELDGDQGDCLPDGSRVVDAVALAWAVRDLVMA